MPYKDPEKQKQAQNESYLRNKEKVRSKSHESQIRRRAFVTEYKTGKPCADCGEFYPPYVLDLDHRDSKNKILNIAQLVTCGGMARLKVEIEKCDIVCSNCHRERTHQGKLTGSIPVNQY